MAAMIEDLPALGKPTSPTSATVFSSRMRSRCCPGSPLSAKPGALRRGLARAALPRPPRPPAAATNLVPTPTRSASTSPSAVLTSVPFGTAMIRSGPLAPVRLEPSPCRPLVARRTGRRWKSSSVAELASTSSTTSPPRPPLPPSGPPSGLNFSRWIEAQPFPPWPACTCSVTRSANSATMSLSLIPIRFHEKGGPGFAGPPSGRAVRSGYADGSPDSAGTMLTARRPRTAPNCTFPRTSANSVSSPPRPTPWPGWKCVPRWRTMISPAFTNWPPYRLTPRRWALESRPLRLDDAPFLCAISVLLRCRLGVALRLGALGLGGRGLGARRLSSRGLGARGLSGRRLSSRGLGARGLGLGADAGDPYLGVPLPVAQTPPVAALVLVLDHVDLGARRVTDDVRRDLVAADLGGVANDPVTVDDQQGGQRDARPGLAVQLVDGDDVIQRDLFLSAAAAHNRVHPRSLFRRAFLACPGAPVVTTAARLHIGARSAGNSRPPRLPDRGASTNPDHPAPVAGCHAAPLAATAPMEHWCRWSGTDGTLLSLGMRRCGIRRHRPGPAWNPGGPPEVQQGLLV